jgi:hypothetical protein
MVAASGRTRSARVLGRAVRGLVAASLLTTLLAGLPWALIYGVGWPLPDRLPSLDEVGAVLMAPMSRSFLLDTLACLAWLLWLVLLVDVAACAVEVARGARWSQLRTQTGPVRRVAAVLVGALLVLVLGRTATAEPAAPVEAALPVGHAPVVATAPAWTTPVASGHTGKQLSQSRSPTEPGTERVRSPENGVHDSLWRIAQRCLGDGARWPEIWALNEGSTQPGGHVLTNPNLVHPGDTLRLPKTSQSPTPAAPQPQPPGHAPTTPAPAAEHAPPVSSTATPPPWEPAPSTTIAAGSAADAEADEPAEGAVTGGGSGEVFVSLGLAAAVSALLMLARRRRQARYRPGSGRRDDLPVAPVVYQLRLAHLRIQHHDEDTELEAETDEATDTEPATHEQRREPVHSEVASRLSTGTPMHAGTGNAGQVRVLAPRHRRVIGAPSISRAGPENVASVVDFALDATAPSNDGDTATATATPGHRSVALDLARVHGLGLVGPGGYAAARALLLTLLTTGPEGGPAPRGLVPAADLVRLLGVPAPATGLPEAVTVVADLDTALAAFGASAPDQPVVLIAAPPSEPDQQARLQHLIDNGAQHGLTALLLGQWRPGVTAYVTAGGIISATDPGRGEPLRGTRAFTLPETATRDLLAFLCTTQPPDDAARTSDDDWHTGPRGDAATNAPVPRQTARPPDAQPSHPENIGGGPDHLEITSGPPAPESSPAAEAGEPDGQPRPLPPRAGDTNPGLPVNRPGFDTPLSLCV